MKQNRVDSRFIDFKKKEVVAVETSCPWMDNRLKKTKEKTVKYSPLRWEMAQRIQDTPSDNKTSLLISWADGQEMWMHL